MTAWSDGGGSSSAAATTSPSATAAVNTTNRDGDEEFEEEDEDEDDFGEDDDNIGGIDLPAGGGAFGDSTVSQTKDNYSVTQVAQGFVDLDLWSSPGWWAATVATYCPDRMVEHPKSKSTKPCARPPGSRCTGFIIRSEKSSC